MANKMDVKQLVEFFKTNEPFDRMDMKDVIEALESAVTAMEKIDTFIGELDLDPEDLNEYCYEHFEDIWLIHDWKIKYWGKTENESK